MKRVKYNKGEHLIPILNGEMKTETRDGRTATFVGELKNGNLVFSIGPDNTVQLYYPVSGLNTIDESMTYDRDLDLFVWSDEPDFNEFEQAVYELISQDEETVRREAARLLTIARKEFMMPTKPVDVLALLKTLNLRILDISEKMPSKDKRFWEQAWRLTNSAINSIQEKEVMNC